jgi:hypothetical protein
MKCTMKIIPAVSLLVITAMSTFAAAANEVPVRRYLLSAGANNGGRDKVVLRYAVSDANTFAAVLIEMGGVSRDNALILANPNTRELLSGVAAMGKKIAESKAEAPNARNEIFVYYSGHADANGLKLGGETLVWADFRSAVDSLDADVKVAVLDACGSGAITRSKGGVAQPVFMSDASSNMKGYAYLTSSNENENSQESDEIRGSFFTHALVSGMRGAADMTGSRRVTVNEAYQYAFNETLQSTQNTRGGTQHPTRDMNLTGTGDIVMTDLRKTSSTLSLDANIEGRFFIRERRGDLIAELSKTRGRSVVLGIPPGQYSVQMETPAKTWMTGDVTIADGGTAVLTVNGMKPMGAKKRTVARGGNANSLSAIADNCIIDLTAYADVSNDMALSLRAGVPWAYALFEYSQPAGGFSKRPKNLGWGVGTHFGMNGKIAASLDFVMSYIYEKNRHAGGDYNRDNYPKDPMYLNLYYKGRGGVSYGFMPRLAVTGGASLNGTMECSHTDMWKKPKRFGSVYKLEDGQGHRFHAWPGVYVGLTVGSK